MEPDDPDETDPDAAVPDDSPEGRRKVPKSATPQEATASVPRTSQRARNLAGEGMRSAFIRGEAFGESGPRYGPRLPRIGHTRGARLLTFLKS
jgi:hypothetical protein